MRASCCTAPAASKDQAGPAPDWRPGAPAPRHAQRLTMQSPPRWPPGNLSAIPWRVVTAQQRECDTKCNRSLDVFARNHCGFVFSLLGTRWRLSAGLDGCKREAITPLTRPKFCAPVRLPSGSRAPSRGSIKGEQCSSACVVGLHCACSDHDGQGGTDSP